eukprot:191002_1
MSASHQTGDTVRVWDPGEDDSGPEENRWRRSGNGEGLTSEKYALKLEQWGPNQLTPAKKESACLKLLKCVFGGFFNILMWVGSVLSFIAYAVEPDPAEQNQYLSLGVVLAFVVSLTGGVMYWQESTSENLMDSFKNFLPPSVNVHRSGVLTQIDAVQLVPGDLIELKAGDKLPADVRFVKATADVQVDNSALTGESDPQNRCVDMTNDDPKETGNLAFFGTLLVCGKATDVVICTGDNTMMGRIARLTTKTANVETQIAKEIERFVLIKYRTLDGRNAVTEC